MVPWDRNRLEKESSTASMTCITARDRPQKALSKTCQYPRTDSYYFIISSRTLYELLKKPIDIKKLRKYIEHCRKCIAACLRAFFDSEGSVRDDGVITIGNTNYQLLKYVQHLLRKFGIMAKGPDLVHRQGTIIHIEGRRHRRRRNVYCLYIKPRDVIKFYRWIGFTIRRKQKRLEEYLRRTGKL